MLCTLLQYIHKVVVFFVFSHHLLLCSRLEIKERLFLTPALLVFLLFTSLWSKMQDCLLGTSAESPSPARNLQTTLIINELNAGGYRASRALAPGFYTSSFQGLPLLISQDSGYPAPMTTAAFALSLQKFFSS